MSVRDDEIAELIAMMYEAEKESVEIYGGRSKKYVAVRRRLEQLAASSDRIPIDTGSVEIAEPE